MEKICCMCNADVSSAKRVKDARGHYYCTPCHIKALERAQAAKAAPVQTIAEIATVSVAEASTIGDDPYMIAIEAPERPAQQPMMGCAGCMKLVPEREVRNIDGEFLCRKCLSERRGENTKTKAARPKPTPEEESKEIVRGFFGSMLGAAVMAAISTAAAWLVYFGLLSTVHGAGLSHFIVADSAAASAGFALAYTLLTVVMAGVLFLSMLIVDQIMGGVEFGALSTAVWKAMAITCLGLSLTLLSHAPALKDWGALIDNIVQPLVLLLGFMLLLRLDFMESIVLSVVNWFLGWAGLLVFAIIMVSMAGSLAHHSTASPVYSPSGGPSMVAPAPIGPAGPAADPAEGEQN